MQKSRKDFLLQIAASLQEIVNQFHLAASNNDSLTCRNLITEMHKQKEKILFGGWDKLPDALWVSVLVFTNLREVILFSILSQKTYHKLFSVSFLPLRNFLCTRMENVAAEINAQEEMKYDMPMHYDTPGSPTHAGTYKRKRHEKRNKLISDYLEKVEKAHSPQMRWRNATAYFRELWNKGNRSQILNVKCCNYNKILD